MNYNFKKKIYRSEKYMRFTREQECPISGWGPCDSHHLGVAGRGLKITDLRCVPLAHLFHQEYHTIGRKAFIEKYNIDLKDVLIENLMKYVCFLEGNNHADFEWKF